MPTLNGKTVLIVEDEILLAMMAEQMLRGFGTVVIGVVATVDAALNFLASTEPDIAIVDIKLADDSAISVLERLEALNVSTLVVTAYRKDIMPFRLPAFPVLLKPYAIADLEAALKGLVDRAQADPRFSN